MSGKIQDIKNIIMGRPEEEDPNQSPQSQTSNIGNDSSIRDSAARSGYSGQGPTPQLPGAFETDRSSGAVQPPSKSGSGAYKSESTGGYNRSSGMTGASESTHRTPGDTAVLGGQSITDSNADYGQMPSSRHSDVGSGKIFDSKSGKTEHSYMRSADSSEPVRQKLESANLGSSGSQTSESQGRSRIAEALFGKSDNSHHSGEHHQQYDSKDFGDLSQSRAETESQNTGTRPETSKQQSALSSINDQVAGLRTTSEPQPPVRSLVTEAEKYTDVHEPSHTEVRRDPELATDSSGKGEGFGAAAGGAAAGAVTGAAAGTAGGRLDSKSGAHDHSTMSSDRQSGSTGTSHSSYPTQQSTESYDSRAHGQQAPLSETENQAPTLGQNIKMAAAGVAAAGASALGYNKFHDQDSGVTSGTQSSGQHMDQGLGGPNTQGSYGSQTSYQRGSGGVSGNQTHAGLGAKMGSSGVNQQPRSGMSSLDSGDSDRSGPQSSGVGSGAQSSGLTSSGYDARSSGAQSYGSQPVGSKDSQARSLDSQSQPTHDPGNINPQGSKDSSLGREAKLAAAAGAGAVGAETYGSQHGGSRGTQAHSLGSQPQSAAYDQGNVHHQGTKDSSLGHEAKLAAGSAVGAGVAAGGAQSHSHSQRSDQMGSNQGFTGNQSGNQSTGVQSSRNDPSGYDSRSGNAQSYSSNPLGTEGQTGGSNQKDHSTMRDAKAAIVGGAAGTAGAAGLHESHKSVSTGNQTGSNEYSSVEGRTAGTDTGMYDSRSTGSQGYTGAGNKNQPSFNDSSDQYTARSTGSQGYTGSGNMNQSSLGTSRTSQDTASVPRQSGTGRYTGGSDNMNKSTPGANAGLNTADDDFGARADDISMRDTREARKDHKSFIEKAKNIMK